MGGELACAFFVGAQGDADEEMVFGFADVAAVDGAGGINGQRAGVEALDGRADGSDFTFAAGGAGTSEDGGMRSEDRCVFNEGGVGVAEIGVRMVSSRPHWRRASQ